MGVKHLYLAPLSIKGQSIMEAFKGKFTRTSAENFEQFLKALDVNMILRKAATVSTPVISLRPGVCGASRLPPRSRAWTSSSNWGKNLMKRHQMVDRQELLSIWRVER